MRFFAKVSIASVFALLVLGVAVASAPELAKDKSTVCGDANNDATANFMDPAYLRQYLWRVIPPALPNPANVDLDDRQLVTARDYLFLLDNQYNSTPLSCPATLPPLNPALDPTSVVSIFPVVVLANATTAQVTLELYNSFLMEGLVIPIQVRVGGQPADAISNFGFGIDFIQMGNVSDRGNGRLLMLCIDSSLNQTYASATRILATFDVSMAGTQPFDRTVSVDFIDLPPIQSLVNVNSPMLFEASYPFTPRLPLMQQNQDVSLTAIPTKVNVGDPVFFTGIATVPVNNATWQWDFGDGNTGTGKTPVHSYDGSLPGPFSVTVSVDPLSGGTAMTTRFKYISLNPVFAAFTGAPRAGVSSLNVQFTDLSSGSPTSWFWDFGDGNTSIAQNPLHTYTTPGIYDVCLTASNALYTDTRCFLAHIKVDAVATPDLQALMFAPAGVRKQLPSTIHATARNIGTAISSGSVLRVDLTGIPATILTTPLPDAVTGQIYEWNLPPLNWDPTQMAFDDFDVKIVITVFSTANVGDKFKMTATVNAVAGETNFPNNTFISSDVVIGPKDPNYKQVQPLGCGGQNIVKETTDLTYFIHFENIPPAASAINIIVVDTLSPSFDWSSLAPGPTSHPAEFFFDEQSGEIVWIFHSINLPANTLPPNGEGFASFSIRPRVGMTLPVQIDNRAQIRFDFEDWIPAPLNGPVTVRVGADANLNSVPDECEACLARGDINGDAIVLTVADYVHLVNFVENGGPAPVSLFEADLNGDCIVDSNDVNKYACFFTFGMSCFPVYPVPTCCSPKIGCCFENTGNVDCDPGDGVDISDLSALIDNLYITFTPLCCSAEANVDGLPGIDISDLSALIDYLYITFTPPAACQ